MSSFEEYRNMKPKTKTNFAQNQFQKLQAKSTRLKFGYNSFAFISCSKLQRNKMKLKL